ncbi:response regulator [Lamprobacter modestohalophilus]|uniref:response regulator n=1 Tax=Lamprobacter modestohalophilus TaxID=1064514 RepID=UPI002ADEE7F1|nr:response regulator [Lamprobacter modestohalophilus]MEA1048286.1 response regulator [Lamprobacter modestohalophilus]
MTDQITDPILIVEDEVRLAELLSDYLRAAGYDTEHLAVGDGVVDWVRAQQPALLLLDLMLPGRDGLSICKELRRFSTLPIIMTTAKVEEIDRLLGLELGADDYICKPYSPREVVARVKAVLRRHGAERSRLPDAAPLALRPEQLRVTANEREIELSAVEFALLQTLFDAPGRIFSRQQLMSRIYQDNRIVSDRTIDSHIKKLRRRLTELHPQRELIHSVYGVGYRYEDREG